MGGPWGLETKILSVRGADSPVRQLVLQGSVGAVGHHHTHLKTCETHTMASSHITTRARACRRALPRPRTDQEGASGGHRGARAGSQPCLAQSWRGKGGHGWAGWAWDWQHTLPHTLFVRAWCARPARGSTGQKPGVQHHTRGRAAALGMTLSADQDQPVSPASLMGRQGWAGDVDTVAAHTAPHTLDACGGVSGLSGPAQGSSQGWGHHTRSSRLQARTFQGAARDC